MSDRSGAMLAGVAFQIISEMDAPEQEKRKAGKRLWDSLRSFDFSPYQMDQDEALISLGLAIRVTYEEGERLGLLEELELDGPEYDRIVYAPPSADETLWKVVSQDELR